MLANAPVHTDRWGANVVGMESQWMLIAGAQGFQWGLHTECSMLGGVQNMTTLDQAEHTQMIGMHERSILERIVQGRVQNITTLDQAEHTQMIGVHGRSILERIVQGRVQNITTVDQAEHTQMIGVHEQMTALDQTEHTQMIGVHGTRVFDRIILEWVQRVSENCSISIMATTEM